VVRSCVAAPDLAAPRRWEPARSGLGGGRVECVAQRVDFGVTADVALVAPPVAVGAAGAYPAGFDGYGVANWAAS
jgi:hypothetical protein